MLSATPEPIQSNYLCTHRDCSWPGCSAPSPWECRRVCGRLRLGTGAPATHPSPYYAGWAPRVPCPTPTFGFFPGGSLARRGLLEVNIAYVNQWSYFTFCSKQRATAEARCLDGGRWRWTNDGRRCSRDTLVVWHHVAHAVAMVQRTTAIPKRKLPRMHTSTGALDWKSPALLVSGSALLGNAGGWDRRTRVCGVLTKGWWAGYSWYDERDRLPDTTPLDRAAGGWERAWRDTSHTKHGWIWKVKRHLA